MALPAVKIPVIANETDSSVLAIAIRVREESLTTAVIIAVKVVQQHT